MAGKKDKDADNLVHALRACAKWGQESFSSTKVAAAMEDNPEAIATWFRLMESGFAFLGEQAVADANQGALKIGGKRSILLPFVSQGRPSVPVLCATWAPKPDDQRTIRVYLFERNDETELVATGFHFDAPNDENTDFAYYHAQLCERHEEELFEKLLKDQTICHDELPRIPLSEWVNSPTRMLYVTIRSLYGTSEARKWRDRLKGSVTDEPADFWKA